MTAAPEAATDTRQPSMPVRRTPWWWWAGVVILALMATWLHRRSGYVFPRPWPDESHFIAPALRLVRFGQLTAPELNAPEGIFWMPHGYYLLQAPLHWLGADALAAPRLLSLVGIWGFAVCVAAVVARAGVHRSLALLGAAAWLAQPLVVVAGNIARMEGPVLGLAGASLWLISSGRWPLAMSVSLLAPLVHPIGLVVPVVVVLSAFLRPERQSWSGAERWLLAAVGVVWALQVGYFVAHADVAAEHVRFQLTRKADRAIEVATAQGLWLLAIAVGGIAATVRWRRATVALTAAWAALALSGALLLIEIVGREMWYEFLGRDTARFLVAAAAAVAISRVPAVVRSGTAGVGVAALLLVAAVVGGVRATSTTQWFGMAQASGTNAEWQEFTTAALEPVVALDANGGSPATVVVDPLSGFGQELFARSWDRLTFVQPTPATPLETMTADYLLATPGAPFVTPSLVEQWGDRPPELSVQSTQGNFTLELYRNPTSAG